MFQDILIRAEKLMTRVREREKWEHLNQEDIAEAKFLMGTIENYAEHQSCFPNRFNQEYISDDGIEKMNLYHKWFECLQAKTPYHYLRKTAIRC